MILVVHPGSRIRILTFYPSRISDPGVKKALDPGFRIPDPQQCSIGPSLLQAGTNQALLIGSANEATLNTPLQVCCSYEKPIHTKSPRSRAGKGHENPQAK